MTAALCAVRGPQEAAVVRALAAGPLAVARRCADLGELLGAAAAGLGQVAVVSADLPGMDREAVRHLHGSAVWVVVVWDGGAGWDEERAGRLGADAVAPLADPRLAAQLAETLVGPGPRTASTVGAGAGAGAVAGAGRGEPPAGRSAGPARPVAAAGPVAPDAGQPPHGRLVAVWGPTGAPGRTTVALGLAEALADEGALLVDADTYGGTVAPMIGLLDEAPGVAAACRTAATGRLDPTALAMLTPVVGPGLRVLTGISRADRWPEVAPGYLEEVWSAARALVPWTVVDCGFGIERDEALSYDTRAPQRNGATLAALGAADLVVVVGAADPIGLQRLVRAVLDLGDLELAAPRLVVVTKVRASAAGPRPTDAIRQALARYAGLSEPFLVPWDPVACDAAVLGGRLLSEVGTGGVLVRAFGELAVQVRGAVLAPAPRAAH